MRIVPWSLVALVVASATSPVVVSAQVCAGRAGREAGSVQLSGGFSSTQGVKQFSVSAGGLGNQAFGNVSAGSISYDDFPGSTFLLGAGTGFRLPIGTSGSAEICPIVSGFLGMGPKDIEGSGIDASSRGAQVGLTAGYRINNGPDFAIIPTVGAGFGYSAFKLSDGVDSLEDSETFGALSFGVGFVIGRQFTALPSVSIPIGLEDSDPVISIGFTLSVGSRR